MGIGSWIAVGLVAGILAKIIHPGKDPGGLIVTLLIGIAGAVIGGFVAVQLGWGTLTGFNVKTLALAVGGGVVLLFVYRLLIHKT